MADSDNLLTYVRMALYDGKLKEYALQYAQEQVQALTPVGTVVNMSGKVHPYYCYGGSWALIDSGYFSADATRYLGLENHGTTSVHWYAVNDSWTSISNVTNGDVDFWNISALTGRRGLTAPTQDAPTTGDKVAMNPVPMEMAIPIHRHENGYQINTRTANNSSLFGSRSTLKLSSWEHNPNYIGWTPQVEEYGDTYKGVYQDNEGGATFEPPYLNVLMWRKISTATGADGAELTDGYDKPDNALFT